MPRLRRTGKTRLVALFRSQRQIHHSLQYLLVAFPEVFAHRGRPYREQGDQVQHEIVVVRVQDLAIMADPLEGLVDGTFELRHIHFNPVRVHAIDFDAIEIPGRRHITGHGREVPLSDGVDHMKLGVFASTLREPF